MTDLKTAAQQALRALKALRLSLLHPDSLSLADASIAALEAALAQQEPRNQCGETCERATLCAVCARGLAQQEATCKESLPVEPKGGWQSAPSLERRGPVAWLYRDHDGQLRLNEIKPRPYFAFPVYTHPPRREWRGLTEEEVGTIRWGCRWNTMSTDDSMILTTKDQVDAFARAIEQALKEKNNG